MESMSSQETAAGATITINGHHYGTTAQGNGHKTSSLAEQQERQEQSIN